MRKRVVSGFVLALSSGVGLVAQIPVYIVNGTASATRLGSSVSIAHDFDGDGAADFVVGAPFDDTNASNAGAAWVVSGATGNTLLSSYGNDPNDLFGQSVGCADVNADGYTDVLVGAPTDDDTAIDAGTVRVISGKDQSVLFVLTGLGAGDRFGWSVAGAGDVNDDGYEDIVVGAPANDTAFINAGEVQVFSGKDQSVLYTLDGAAPLFNFGWSVAGAGDVNGDGFADFAVGTPSNSTGGVDAGSVHIYSGADGTLLHVVHGAAGSQLGFSVAGVGDVNGDGSSDVIAGAPMSNVTGTLAGRVVLISGADGTLLHTFDGMPGDTLGRSVGRAGDVDGDGVPDLLAGAPLHDDGPGLVDAGRAVVWSGATSRVLYSIEAKSAGEFLGAAVAGAGDANGDGFADLVVGAPRNGTSGADSGRALVYTLVPFDELQEVAPVTETAVNSSQYGARLGIVGDVNNDGVPDYMVGAPFDQGRFGTAWLYSGADRSLIRSHTGPTFDAWYAIRVGGVGDVNQDGYGDYGVGAFHYNTTLHAVGAAFIYSGFDGSIIYSFFGSSVNDHLGASIGPLGDVDDDGVDDFFVSVGHYQNFTGGVFVYSGATGTKIYETVGQAPSQWYGWSVVDLGDVNGDGKRDYVAGAPSGASTPPGTGYADVVSGADGTLIYRINGAVSQDRFGWMVDNAGDVDLDGINDILVGADGYDPPGKLNAGGAFVYSGKTGTLLFQFDGEAMGDGFGVSVAGGSDIDGDGYPDFVVGAPLADPPGVPLGGKTYVYSGQDGSLLAKFEGLVAGDDLGRAVMSMHSDTNGDGYPEVVVGVAKADNGGTDNGEIRVFESTVRTDPGRLVTYGAGCPGSDGRMPQLAFTGRPVITETYETKLSSALPGTTAVLFLNVTSTSFAFGPGAPGCTLLVSPFLSLPFSTDTAGRASLPITLPNDPLFVGVPLYEQWVVIDPAANGFGFVMSRAGYCLIGMP